MRNLALHQLPDKPGIRNAAGAGAFFHGVEQGLRNAHVDVRGFGLELELDGCSAGEIVFRKVGGIDKILACWSVSKLGIFFFIALDLLPVHVASAHWPDVPMLPTLSYGKHDEHSAPVDPANRLKPALFMGMLSGRTMCFVHAFPPSWGARKV